MAGTRTQGRLGHCGTAIPGLGRRGIDGRAFRAAYSADNLSGPIREELISDAECNQLARDLPSGSGAVERVLTSLLAG